MSTHESQAAADWATRHMEELVDELPAMLEKQARRERHEKAVPVYQQWKCVDELEQALAILHGQSPFEAAAYGGMHEAVIREKELQLAQEQARLASDLVASPFADVQEAAAALLDERALNGCIDELNRYRRDYAYTLAQCERASA
ncbi:MAG: hypothetical protein KHY83_06695 [Coriobacteriia bacterium]|nr:hypothetical protein [Coriobacteriia bacterium]MBS5478336.1 hypothetical protein [Coriobacteriia bacterium]